MKPALKLTATAILHFGITAMLTGFLYLAPGILALEDQQTALLAASHAGRIELVLRTVPVAILITVLTLGICLWFNRLCLTPVPSHLQRHLTAATLALLLSGYVGGAALFLSGSAAYPVPASWLR